MTRLLALVAGVLAVAAAPAAAASRIPGPTPPQNPHLAPDPGSNIHDDTWMTDAYARGGPARGTLTALSSATESLSLCGSLTFDRRGRILSVCPSTVAPPVLRLIDPVTLDSLASYTLPQAPTPAGTKEFQNFAGGGYFFLDQRGRVWSATKTNHLLVLALNKGAKGFHVVSDYDLTKVVTGGERITSALPDFSGRIWFVTRKDGKVGVLNTKTRRIRVKKMGEEIENSFAVGRSGVFVVSDKRMYRFDAGRDGRPHVTWKVRYRNSQIHKPSQVDAGSGTTPTILPHGLVAITDNADPMNVVVYRTGKRLGRHQKRTVCTVPVFSRGHSATENSLIGSGRSLIVENNYGYADPFAPGPVPLTSPGFARVDLNAKGTGCHRVWTNTTVRGASVVPKLSTKTQLVYAYAQDGDDPLMRDWSWVALSARTGKTVFTVPAGSGLLANNNYAGIALGPDGRTAYLGTIGGMRALRASG